MKSLIFWSAVTLVLITAPSAHAQSGEGGIFGQGTAEIKRRPQTMRVSFNISAKGSTLKDALAALKEKQQGLSGKLAKLKADDKSVKIGDPQVQAIDPRRSGMVSSYSPRGVKRPGKKPEVKPPVTVTASVTAEWPLKAKDGEELLLLAHDLGEQLNAADLPGLKDAGKLTPEEEELAEEMAGMDRDEFDGRSGGPPGLRIMYVTPITAEEHQQALTEAFAKAKKKAEQISRASGAPLGALRTLGASNARNSGRGGYDEYEMYRRRGYPVAASDDDEDNPHEAVGGEPQSVSLTVTVNASFAIGKMDGGK